MDRKCYTRRVGVVALLTLTALALFLGSVQAQQFESQALLPGDLAEGGGSGFGYGVAIWRDYIVVGATQDSPQDNPALHSGAVYVYQFEDGVWVERAKLKGSETGWEDQLGWSLAIEGNLIVAGAPHLTLDGSGMSAAVYVFRRDDNGTPANPADDVWHEEAILTPDPSDREFSDGFGRSVAVSGDTIVSGAAGAGVIGFIEERAYVYRRDGTGWVQEAILVGSDTEAGDSFGSSVAIWEDTILVGAHRHDRTCPPEYPECGTGAAYVFSRNSGNWGQDVKLVASDGTPRGAFGRSVAIYQDMLAISAFNSAYVFRRSAGAWAEERVLTPSEGAPGFGTVLSAACRVVVGGAPYSDSALIFRWKGREWIQQPKLVASGAFGQSVGVGGAYAVVGAIGSAYLYAVLANHTDLLDFAEFQRCFGRYGLPNGCGVFDLVPDRKVDVTDYALFLPRLNGP